MALPTQLTVVERTVWQRLELALGLGLRASLAAFLSVAAAKALWLPYPIYAMIGAVIVTDLSPSETKKLGLRRLAGTALGAFFGGAASLFLGNSAGAIGLTVLSMILICYLLNLKGAAKVAGYISAIVVLDHGNSPWLYAVSRFMETGIGILLAILTSWAFIWILELVPPRFHKWVGAVPRGAEPPGGTPDSGEKGGRRPDSGPAAFEPDDNDEKDL